jgi:hypothetical protein
MKELFKAIVLEVMYQRRAYQAHDRKLWAQFTSTGFRLKNRPAWRICTMKRFVA